MAHAIEEVIESVNRRVQPRRMVEFFGVGSSNVSELGTTLKAYCPMHRGESFKTLFFDQRAGTCQCIVKECPAHERQSFVAFTALVRGILPLEAAVLLARESNIALDEELIDAAVVELVEGAQDFLTAGRGDDARKRLETARRLRPTSRAAMRALALYYERLGTPAEAVALWQEIASGSIPSEAVVIYEAQILRLDPEHEGALGTLAGLLLTHQPQGPRWAELLWRRARLRFAKNNLADAMADFRNAEKLFGNRPEFLQQKAELALAMGDVPHAADSAIRAATLFEERAEDSAAVACLERLLSFDTDNAEARQRLEQLHERVGNLEVYLARRSNQGKEAFEAGNWAAAEKCFLDVVRREPANIEARLDLAATCEKTGQAGIRREHLLMAAERLASEGTTARALELFHTLAAEDFEDGDQLHRLARGLRAAGDLAGARPVAVKAFQSAASNASSSSAIRAFGNSLLEGDADQPELLLAVAERYAAFGARDAALPLLQALMANPALSGPNRRSVLQLLHDMDPQDAAAAMDLARLQIEGGEIEEGAGTALIAAELYAETGAAVPCIGALRLVLDHTTSSALRLAALDRLVGMQPDDPAIRLEFVDELDAAKDRSRANVQRLVLARQYLDLQQVAEAERIFEALPPAIRESEESLPLLLELQLRGRQWKPAAETIRRVITRSLRDNQRAADGEEALRKACQTMLDHEEAGLARELLLENAFLAERHPALVELCAMACEQTDDCDPAPLWELACNSARTQGDHRKALVLLQRAIATSPETPRYRRLMLDLLDSAPEADPAASIAQHFALSELMRRAGDTDTAIVHLEAILQIDPEHLVAMRELFDLLTEQRETVRASGLVARIMVVAEKYSDEETLRSALESSLALNPRDLDALNRLMELASKQNRLDEYTKLAYRLADQLEGSSHWEEAMRIYESIAHLNEADTAARHRLFELYLAAGEPQRAADSLREIYRVHLAEDNLPLAIETLKRVESVDRDNPETLELLAHLYQRLSDLPQSANYFRAAASRRFHGGQHESALLLTDEVLRVLPTDEAARLLRAEIHLSRQDMDKALGELRQLAQIHARAEQHEKQAETLERILRLVPEDVTTREGLAYLLNDLDRPRDSMEQFLKLSATLEKANDMRGAIEAAGTACTLVPDSCESRARLAELHLRNNDENQATPALLWLADYYEGNSEYETALLQIRRSPQFNESSYLMLRAAKLTQLIGQKGEAKELTVRAARKAAHHNEGKTERQALRAALDIDPSDLEALATLTSRLLSDNNHTEAVEQCFRSIDYFMNEGDIDQAVEVYNNAVAISADPNGTRQRGVDLFVRHEIPELAAREAAALSREFLALEQFDDALIQIDRALSLKPRDSAFMEAKFLLLQRLDRIGDARDNGLALAEHYKQRGDWTQAVRVTRRLTEILPESTDVRVKLVEFLALAELPEEQTEELRRLADLYLQKQALAEAVESLRLLMSIKPDDTRARIRYIDIYKQVSDETDLIDDYLKLADIHARHGAHLEATRVYEKALAVAPEFPRVYERFIAYLQRQSQTTRAQQHSVELTALLLKQDKPRQALEALALVGDALDGDPMIHLLRGRAHLALRARGMAAKELRVAARIFATTNQAEAEVGVLEELIAIDPQDAELLHRRVDLLQTLGRQPEAIRELERLGALYRDRNLMDLAVAEYRRILTLDSERIDIWRDMIAAESLMGAEREASDDCTSLADLLSRQGKAQEAIDVYTEALTLNTRNLRARRGYVTQYPRVGKLRDIVDEILVLAQQLVEEGEVDEGVRYFELVMSVDPKNTVARDMLSATQSRHESGERPLPKASSPLDEYLGESSDTVRKPTLRDEETGTPSASSMLRGELDTFDKKEKEDTLGQVVNNYRDILAVNAQNAAVRVKLADVLEQMGRVGEALEELFQATEIFYRRDELAQCISTCERFLAIRPQDQRVRKRLNEAVLRIDAMRALDSSIMYSEKNVKEPPRTRQ